MTNLGGTEKITKTIKTNYRYKLLIQKLKTKRWKRMYLASILTKETHLKLKHEERSKGKQHND